MRWRIGQAVWLGLRKICYARYTEVGSYIGELVERGKLSISGSRVMLFLSGRWRIGYPSALSAKRIDWGWIRTWNQSIITSSRSTIAERWALIC